MKKTILTLLGFILALLQVTAAPFVISGKVLHLDRTFAEGTKVTISDPAGEKTGLTDKYGQYSIEYGGFFEETRLLDIKIEKQGYRKIELSKVIASSFGMEDLVLVPDNEVAYKPSIGLIAQSEYGNNIVAWERDKRLDIEYYIVKRKNEKGVYDSIAMVNYHEENSLYLDREAKNDRSYFYQIEAVFTNGKKSVPSDARKSFNLNYEIQKNGNSVELVFDFALFNGMDYPATHLSTVDLLRSDNGAEFKVIGSEKVANISYKTVEDLIKPDTLREAGKYIYQVAVNFHETCDPSINRLKSDSGPFSQSLSNLAEVIIKEEDVNGDSTDPTTPVRSLTDFGLSRVYPIPSNESFTAEANGVAQLVISALSGVTVLDTEFKNQITVSSNTLAPGMYKVSITENGKTKTFTQVIK